MTNICTPLYYYCTSFTYLYFIQCYYKSHVIYSDIQLSVFKMSSIVDNMKIMDDVANTTNSKLTTNAHLNSKIGKFNFMNVEFKINVRLNVKSMNFSYR